MTRLIDWAIAHPAPAIAAWLLAGAVAFLAAYCAIGALWDAIDQRRVQRGIRALERHIQNPAVRAMYLAQPRREKP
ncbi:hypothetical protein ABZ876_08155 [Streptomyces sp. NPDC046931]|uniref:hypothetical protein n=1 Tax=Streptomyces sp. NPDC046931 TaxID=3154806 RepID=UPI00340684AF